MTIADVARKAGCSIVTVSRVLNDRPDVSPTTRERVRAIMAELGYRPDARVRGLARRESRVLGLVLANLTSTYTADHVRAVEATARRHGYRVILCNSSDDPTMERENLEILQEHRVDGVLIMPSRLEGPHIADVARGGLPVVLLGRYVRDADLDLVMNDHVATGRLATAHLTRVGRTRIAFVGRRGVVSTLVDRLAGYREALEAAGLPYDPSLVVMADQTPEGGQSAIGRLMRLPRPPDAVFAFNDSVAFGVLRGLAALGRRVPDDVAVVGSENVMGGDLLAVPLTTVIQSGYDIGERATALLLRRIKSPGAPDRARVVTPPRLLVRESCGARAAGLADDEATA